MNPTITPDPVFGSSTNAQTPGQLAAAQGLNQTGGNASGSLAPQYGPPVSQTQDASQINGQMSGDSTGVIFPQAPGAPTTGVSNNLSVPNPLPSAADIISQGTQQTPAEATNQTLLQKVAALIGGGKGQTELTNTAEANAGIPALSKTVNDLSAQLEGLNNQSLDLQNQANYTVPNQNNLKLNGTDATAGGLSGMNANDVRNLQIQQGAIASRALTLKSAIYAAQGNLTLAKDAADKAATAQYEEQQRQIDYQTALIKANEPSMTKQEQAQADLVKQNLADRQTKINLQIDNYKTGQAAIADALKNNPTNPQAQEAAKQATQLDPNDPNYLLKVHALVGKYGSDLAKRALDQQLEKAQIDKAQADAAKARSTINDAGDTISGLAQQLVTGMLAPSELSKRTSGAGANYNAILTAADKYSMQTTGKHFNISQADRDYKYANNAQTQNTLNYLGSLLGSNGQPGNLDELLNTSNALTRTSFPALNNVAAWTRLQTGDPEITAYYTTVTEVSDQIAKILQGGGTGSGTSDAKLAQAQALFQKGFTKAQVQANINAIKPLLLNRAKGIVGDNPYLSDYSTNLGLKSNASQSVTVNGQTYSVGKVYTDKSGNWTVDANGKWTKQ